MKEIELNPEDEASITEISILPDGRVYLFGTSQQVLEVLHAIPLGDPAIQQRLDRLMCDATNVEHSDQLRHEATP
jgi:hypothetical protein